MNREIKFRVWFHDAENIKNGEWITLDDETEGKDSVVGLGIALFTHNECLKYCQYTGLKDKNGREIYEGDIVKVNHPYMDYFLMSVIYDDNEARFNLPISIENSFEVIGNIYENPELLFDINTQRS